MLLPPPGVEDELRKLNQQARRMLKDVHLVGRDDDRLVLVEVERSLHVVLTAYLRLGEAGVERAKARSSHTLNQKFL